MNRRGFLVTSGVTAGIAIGISFIGLKFFGRSLQESLERVVRHYIGDDRLVPGAAHRFAEEFARLHSLGSISQTPLSRCISKQWLGRITSYSIIKTERFERLVITAFVEASDLSSLPSESTKPIDFVRIQPFRTCNPFAQILP